MTLRGDNMARLKRHNRSIILSLLHQEGELSRKQLAKRMALTPAAITLITGEMISEGLLRESGLTLAANGSGRREVPLMIACKSLAALGVTIDISEAILSATTLDGNLLFSQIVLFDSYAPAETTINTICQNLTTLMSTHNIDKARIVGLGIGVRGLVDRKKELSVNSLGAFHQKNLPLRRLFEEASGLTTTLDNNVRSMFRAHRFFTKDTETSALFVRCARGIGSAVSADGQLIVGDSGKCAELGHIPVVEIGGKPCFCGKTGCLETVSTETAIISDVSAIYSAEATPKLYQTTGGHVDRISIYNVFASAESGDLSVDAIVQNAASKLSSVLKVLAYTLDPSGILLYGQIFEQEYYLRSLCLHYKRGTELNPVCPVIKSSLNLVLEDNAACIIAIEAFFAGGGFLEHD